MKNATHTYRNRPVRIAAAGSTPETVVIELLDSTYIDATTEHYNTTEVYMSELTATTTDAELNTATCGCTGYDYCAVCAQAEDVVSITPTVTIADTTIPVGATVTIAHRNGTLDHGIVDSHIHYSGGVVWYRIHTAEGQYMDCPPEKVFSTPTPTLTNEDVWQAVAEYEAGYPLTHEQKTLLLAAANDTTRRDVVIMHSLGLVTTLQALVAKVEGRPSTTPLYSINKTIRRVRFDAP